MLGFATQAFPNMPSIDQWRSTWMDLGVSVTPAVSREFAALMARYGEPHRKYHTARHLDECFEKLAELRNLTEHPAEVELAIWFHDAIHEPGSADNEARSADLAVSKAAAAGVAAECTERVRSLIMATKHTEAPCGIDAEVLVDVDLAILGAGQERFEEYEEQVRAEYSWLPDSLFTRERKKILREFLARPSIFSTSVFRARYESQARANIERSMDRLNG
jgi:predicted metal-dependent HD superfamily phosphohydrolase